MVNPFRISQEELAYIYEHAQGRMSAHPEHAAKQKEIIRNAPSFQSEKEALQAALRMIKDTRSNCQIWAGVEKDEEYYRITGPWIVSDDITVLVAADYIGMAQLYDQSKLLYIIQDIINALP